MEKLKGYVEAIKYKGSRKGIEVTNEEIAQKLDITKEKFEAYLNGKENVPNDVIHKLELAYKLQPVQITHVSSFQKKLPKAGN